MKSTTKPLLFTFILFVALILPGSHTRAEDIPTFVQTDCPFLQQGDYPVDCGYVIVPEDHAHPDSATIQLAIAIIRSSNPNKASDPVIYLAGGPGGAFVQTAPLLPHINPSFAALLMDRDLIVVDQRGMGLSRPSISCPIFDSALDMFARNFPTPTMTKRLNACPAQLAAKGIHVQYFTSEQNAADFDSIRQALGYQQVNLYGVSYGTLLGLVALRDYPQGIRSVVLDSVLPPNVNSNEYAPIPFENAFNRMVTNCNADTVCRVSYPDLKQAYQQAFEHLRATPAKIDVDGKSFTFNELNLQDTVYRGLASDAGNVPATITELANGNFDLLKPFFKRVLEASVSDLPNLPLYAAMICPQMGATTSPERIASVQNQHSESFRNPGVTSGIGGYLICKAWGNVQPASLVPAVSDVPVLLLSGEYDDLTAPEWAHAASQTLTHSYAYEFPGLGHGVGNNDCAQRVIVSFIRNPDTAPYSTCIKEIPGANFVISISVTRPLISGATILLVIFSLPGIAMMSFIAIRRRKQITWRTTFRKMGIWGPLTSLFSVIVLIASDSEKIPLLKNGLSALQIAMPLIIGIQTALLFSPDEEPGLEMLLATPRPLSWLIMERLGVIFLSQSVIAVLLASIVKLMRPESEMALLLLSWLPSALFLSGVALCVTLRSRLATFGATIVAFLWIMIGLFGSAFKPGQAFAFPINIIQPFLWAFSINAAPGDFIQSDFLLNRFFLAGAGVCLIMLALREIRDPEQMLLNQQRKKSKRLASDTPRYISLRVGQVVTPVNIAIQPAQQLLAIAWYEFKMHRRRRIFKFITIFMIVMGLFFPVIFGRNINRFAPTLPALDTIPLADLELIRGLIFVTFGAGSTIWTFGFILPLLVVDTVPYDHQHKISETMNSLPLKRSVYLAGKIAGIWLTGVVSMAISLTVIVSGWWAIMGSMAFGPAIDMLIYGALPLLIFNTTASILIGATQGTRRSALLVLIGLFAGPLILSSFVDVFKFAVLGSFDVMGHYLADTISLTMMYPPQPLAPAFSIPAVRDALLLGAVQTVLLWFIVVNWSKLRHSVRE